MAEQTVFANATLILPDEVARGSICVSAGKITDASTGASMPRGALDLVGDTSAPCLIEVHTDSHERPLEARLKVRWPYRA